MSLSYRSATALCSLVHLGQGGIRGVAGVAAATPFFEPEKIRNFVISFLRLIRLRKKNPATPFLKS